MNYFNDEFTQRTSLAAEYPEGLCLAWAQALWRWALEHWPRRKEDDLFEVCGVWGNQLIRKGVKRKVNLTSGQTQVSPTETPLTRARVREAENQACLGGLRNPNRAVARSPGLRAVGERVRGLLQTFVEEKPHLDAVLDQLGSAEAEGFILEDITELRRRLAEEFQIAAAEEVSNCRIYWTECWEKLVAVARDPETMVPCWLRNGFPLGIRHEIAPVGVFPEVTEDLGGGRGLTSSR